MIAAYQPLAAIFSHDEIEHRFAKGYQAFSPLTVRAFDTVDLAFLREMRQSWLKIGGIGEPEISPATLTADGLGEAISVARSDVTFVVSEFERTLLTERLFLDADRIRIVSSVHEPDAVQRQFPERDGFVFLGGFQHPPNVDAVRWIVADVWPLIRAKLEQASLFIYGSSMPADIKALDSPTHGIFARGFVADHRKALADARVMLTPLQYGAGVKGKIGEALAVGTPVVTTAIGAEGMDESGRALAIAEDSMALAEWACRLHCDADEWAARSAAGLEIIRERFSAAANVDAMLDAIAYAQQAQQAPSRWTLTSRMLWWAAGLPGRADDFERACHEFYRKHQAQAALIEEYRVVLARLRESEMRLQRDLALSTAARQKLVKQLR